MGGGASRAAHLAAIEQSFLGVLLPDKDWSPFCQLWNYEQTGKSLTLRNKLCFIIVVGKVDVYLTNSKGGRTTPSYGDQSSIARTFKRGDVIHLFSNQDKVDIDGTSLIFDNVRLTFVPEKGTNIISLDCIGFKQFIDERPRLTSLSAFMKLRMSELVANHVYFEGLSPNKVNMLGPLLSLKRAHAKDVLFQRGLPTPTVPDSTMGLVISGICLALHDDKKVEDVKNLINAHNRFDPHHGDTNTSSSGGLYSNRESSEIDPQSVYYGSGGGSRRRAHVLEALTPTMRHVASTPGTTIVPELGPLIPPYTNLEDQGEVLRSGTIFGFERIVLPAQRGFKNVLAIKNSVVAQFDFSIFKCLQRDDYVTSKTISRNIAFSLVDSLGPCVPLLAELERAPCMSLASKVTFESHVAGSEIFKLGGTGTKFHVILQGETKEITDLPPTPPNERSPESNYFNGDYFGEVAIMTGSPYSTTMIATKNTVVMTFSERTLRLVLRDDQAKLAEMKLRIKGSDLELTNILNFPPACALFEEYMIGEHAPENLFFWKAVERFEDICIRLEKQLEKLKNGEEIPIRYGPTGGHSMRLKTTVSAMIPPPAPVNLPNHQNNHNSNNQMVSSSSMFINEESVSAKSNVLRSVSADPALVVQQVVSGKKAYSDGVAQLRDVVRVIMEQYVFEGSCNQVNLPGKLRVQLEKDVTSWLDATASIAHQKTEKEQHLAELDIRKAESRKLYFHTYSKAFSIPKELFVKAKSECYMIMRKDTFARWRFTDQFSTFFDSLLPLANARNNNDSGSNSNNGSVHLIKGNSSSNNDNNNGNTGNNNGNGNNNNNNNNNNNTNAITSASMMRRQSLIPGTIQTKPSSSSMQLTLFTAPISHQASMRTNSEEKAAIPNTIY